MVGAEDIKDYKRYKKAEKPPDLEPVYGSTYCQYSVIENKLATLYKNQEKIYSLLKLILEKR